MRSRQHLGNAGVAALVLVCASPATATVSLAPADAAAYHGLFHTSCSMPMSASGARSGDYRCDHTAWALQCSGIADSGSPASWAKSCRATLVASRTRGHASVASGGALWTCDDGTGSGLVDYQPSPLERTVRVPVTLAVTGDSVVVDGTYRQARTGRTIVVRARFPAVCSWDTQIAGYSGTVSLL